MAPPQVQRGILPPKSPPGNLRILKIVVLTKKKPGAWPGEEGNIDVFRESAGAPESHKSGGESARTAKPDGIFRGLDFPLGEVGNEFMRGDQAPV